MYPLLSAQNIIKSFGAKEEKRNVLNGVSVTIGHGEFVSVMGPSGSGKSTLLYTLSGMDSVDAGEVTFGQHRLSSLSDRALSDLRRRQIGFVFQHPTLLKNLSILDNILLPQARGHHKNRKELAQRAKSLMEQMGIASLEQRGITQVSGGQLQRAGICRALLGQPQILFCDEPTGALNSQAAKEVMSLFTQINASGAAIFMVTHDAGVAARADRVLFLCDGKIVSEIKLGRFSVKDADQRTSAVLRQMRAAGI